MPLIFCLLADAAPPQPMTLSAWIAAVIEAHPRHDAAASGIAAAEAKVAAVSGWESLRFEGMIGPFTGDPEARLMLMTMPIGAARADRAMARAGVDMAAADLRMTELELATRATDAWAEWWRLGETLPRVVRTAAVLETIETSARDRYARGLGALAPALAADREAVMLEADRGMLLARQQAVKARLNALLDRPPEEPLPPAARSAPPGTTPGEAVTVALGEARVAEAQAGAELARAGRGPALGAMLAWEGMGHDGAVPLMAGVVLELPVDAGALRAGERAARAEADAAASELAALGREAAASARAARLEADGAWAMARTLQERLVGAAEAEVASARAGYEAGHGDATMWLMAEVARLDAERRGIDAEAAAWRMEAMVWMADGRLPEGYGGSR